MALKQAVLQLHKFLSEAKIDHALIGGFALAVHGINRATGDIDLLVDEKDKSLLLETLSRNGYKLKQDVTEALHFDGPVSLDILLARRAVSKEMLARAKPAAILGVKCLDPEDLVGLKIQAYSNNPRRELQDKADIQFLFNKYPQMDWERVKRYADAFHQWTEIEKLRAIK
jgi:hypothetical protein